VADAVLTKPTFHPLTERASLGLIGGGAVRLAAVRTGYPAVGWGSLQAHGPGTPDHAVAGVDCGSGTRIWSGVRALGAPGTG
jgi:hypothetical protein